MNYDEIRSRFFEMKRIMWHTLYHVLTEIVRVSGRNCEGVNFYNPNMPMVWLEDKCSGDRSPVLVYCLFIDGNGKICLIGNYMDDDNTETGTVVIEEYDGDTCRILLDALLEGDPYQYTIKPYYPQPQTIVALGSELSREASEVTPETREAFINSHGSRYIARRNWITEGEREAYVKGCEDTSGYTDFVFI